MAEAPHEGLSHMDESYAPALLGCNYCDDLLILDEQDFDGSEVTCRTFSYVVHCDGPFELC